MVDLEDPRTGKIADAISNNTCKKILAVLSEKELSEGDISKELDIPLNTVGYNIKKLVEASLIEKSKQFFWSAKGKRIPVYKISNKRIIISPKSMIRGIIPAVIISGFITLGIGLWNSATQRTAQAASTLQKGITNISATAEAGAMAKESAGEISAAIISSNAWLWFLTGALTALFIFLIWNWFRKK